MSTSKMRPIVEKHSVLHARAGDKPQGSKGGFHASRVVPCSVSAWILKPCGADVSFLSVFAHEQEYIFPPARTLSRVGTTTTIAPDGC